IHQLAAGTMGGVGLTVVGSETEPVHGAAIYPSRAVRPTSRSTAAGRRVAVAAVIGFVPESSEYPTPGDSSMAFVVAEPCIACKYTDCVAVCPVDCFYEGANFLVIHPDECIDCGACEPVCPTKAIFPEDDLTDKWKEYPALNAA